MTVVGAAVILGLIIAADGEDEGRPGHRWSSSACCSAWCSASTPIGDGVNAGLAVLGRLVGRPDHGAVMPACRRAGTTRPCSLRPQVVRVSLWAVFGLWLARRLGRLLLLIVRSPAAMISHHADGRRSWPAGSWSTPRCRSACSAAWSSGWSVWRLRWPASFERHVLASGSRLVARRRGSTGGGGRRRWTPPA